ncbi:XRE family transcriptional regulator [Devosia geojensis]|uniref:XRE family transcriptional regulator n=2 Tax=Devosia geojensis TaxID=443610 RepID=A0A0F5FWK6_9HYPH|nr:XRE family transcriptional regulator [Devosia geojensis]
MTGKSNDMTKHPVEPDPDAPLTDAEFERDHAAMLARRARAATGLSQRDFAERYGIPVSSLRDWEQGRRLPDSAAQSYLRVIARLPEDVARVLHAAA